MEGNSIWLILSSYKTQSRIILILIQNYNRNLEDIMVLHKEIFLLKKIDSLLLTYPWLLNIN